MEARLLGRTGGSVVVRKSAFEIEEVLPPFPSRESEAVAEDPASEPAQDDGQEQAPQQQGGDDPFALLGQALDEIDAEARAETKECMAPTRDVAEIMIGRETRYRRMTRTLICTDVPPLAATPHVERTGRLITTVDGALEELLTISLERARSAFEQKRVCDVGRLTRRAR